MTKAGNMAVPARQLGDRRGIAAVEFAIVAPVMLVLLGSVIDYSLLLWNKALLASSAAQGAEYALLIGTTVTTANVQTVVGQTLSLPTANVTVKGPDCYCVTGVPATSTLTVCVPTPSCIDPKFPINPKAAGTYLKITAKYTYSPMMPLSSGLVSNDLTESVMVRLK